MSWRVFSRQYWSILANTGCHTHLEHYISCCPSCQPPLSTWCCQNPCNPSSCTTSTPGPHRGKPKPSRAASGANPSGCPTCRGGNKTTIETQWAVWLRKKTQNLPTSCTSCRLNPHNQLGRLCVYGIYKRTLSAPTKENALALMAVDIGGKNTLEQDQIRS